MRKEETEISLISVYLGHSYYTFETPLSSVLLAFQTSFICYRETLKLQINGSFLLL